MTCCNFNNHREFTVGDAKITDDRHAYASEYEGEYIRHLNCVHWINWLRDLQEFVRSCKPLFLSNGFLPSLIDQLQRGTDEGEGSCLSYPSFPYLTLTLSVLFSVELDQLTFHMNVKWHHAWSKRIIDPNASPESVQPAYAVQPLPEDTEMDYMNA